MPLYLKMSENINETRRHLRFRYISILTNIYIYIYIYIYIISVCEHAHPIDLFLKNHRKEGDHDFLVKVGGVIRIGGSHL